MQNMEISDSAPRQNMEISDSVPMQKVDISDRVPMQKIDIYESVPGAYAKNVYFWECAKAINENFW